MSEQKAQEFYLELSEMFDDNKCLEHEKIIALIRVALEKGGQGEMGETGERGPAHHTARGQDALRQA